MISSEILVTSSGIIKNRSKPRSGIVNASSLYRELFEDCMSHGIDLSWESYIDETLARLKSENPDMDDSDIDQLLCNEAEHVEFDSRVFLLGAWVKGKDGKYSIDKSGKNGDYALEYNTGSGIVSVEWSILTKPCQNTSPCYVMSDGSGPCGNLDRKGDEVIAFTLPGSMFFDENEAIA